MALYRAHIKQKAIVPQFQETLICDNTALDTSGLTLTQDYADFDFLRIELYNTVSQARTPITTTPEVITNIKTYSYDKVNFNEYNSNQYICYTLNSATSWSRNAWRSCVIEKIYGINCTNGAVSKDVIYNKEAATGTTATDIVSVKSFNEYDYIFFATATGDTTETQVVNMPYHKDTTSLIDYTQTGTVVPFVYNAYNSTSTLLMEDNRIPSFARAFYILGVTITLN